MRCTEGRMAHRQLLQSGLEILFISVQILSTLRHLIQIPDALLEPDIGRDGRAVGATPL